MDINQSHKVDGYKPESKVDGVSPENERTINTSNKVDG